MNHEPLITCPVPGCDSAFKILNSHRAHIRGKTTHRKKLSAAKITEYIEEAARRFKIGRAEIKKAFEDAKAAAQNKV